MTTKWDIRFIEHARLVSTYSKDPSTKVGAILVQPDLNEIVGSGYNGFPRGVADTEERLFNRELKYEFVVHAEVNAVINAGHRARGSTLYLWPTFGYPPVCARCAGVIAQAGIRRIVAASPRGTPEQLARWNKSLEIAKQIVEETGIIVEFVEIQSSDVELIGCGSSGC